MKSKPNVSNSIDFPVNKVFFFYKLWASCVLSSGHSVRQCKLTAMTLLCNIMTVKKELTKGAFCKRSKYRIGREKKNLLLWLPFLIMLRNTKSLEGFHSAIFCLPIPQRNKELWNKTLECSHQPPKVQQTYAESCKRKCSTVGVQLRQDVWNNTFILDRQL